MQLPLLARRALALTILITGFAGGCAASKPEINQTIETKTSLVGPSPTSSTGSNSTATTSVPLPPLQTHLSADPVTVKVTTFEGHLSHSPQHIEAQVKPLSVKAEVEASLKPIAVSANLGKLEVTLDPSPMQVELRGWPDSLPPLEVRWPEISAMPTQGRRGADPTNATEVQSGTTPDRGQRSEQGGAHGADGFWRILWTILLAGAFGGLARTFLDSEGDSKRRIEAKETLAQVRESIPRLHQKHRRLADKMTLLEMEILRMEIASSIDEQPTEATTNRSVELHQLQEKLSALEVIHAPLDRDLRQLQSEERRLVAHTFQLGPILIIRNLANGIIAGAMLPGVLLFTPDSLLTALSQDYIRILSLGSLCLIAATLGQPFLAFVLGEASAAMERRRRERTPPVTSSTNRPPQTQPTPVNRPEATEPPRSE